MCAILWAFAVSALLLCDAQYGGQLYPTSALLIISSHLSLSLAASHTDILISRHPSNT